MTRLTTVAVAAPTYLRLLLLLQRLLDLLVGACMLVRFVSDSVVRVLIARRP